jgi:hypothetical protein
MGDISIDSPTFGGLAATRPMGNVPKARIAITINTPILLEYLFCVLITVVS